MDQALLEGRVTVEDPDVACSVVDNVLLLHLLNCNKTVLYDVGLSSAQAMSGGQLQPRPSGEQLALLPAAQRPARPNASPQRDQFEVEHVELPPSSNVV